MGHPAHPPTMLVVALTVGVLVGVALGALGGGGSILTLPVLVYLLGMPPHEATAGSLLVVGLTAAAGLLTHARHGRVRWRQGFLFGALGILGAVGGTHLSAALDPATLLAAFAALLLVAAVAMAVRQRQSNSPPDHARGQPSDRQVWPGTPPRSRWTPARIARLILAATAVGLLTGFFGVGGGFLVVPALVLALAFDMPTAVGTSLLVITVNSATALAARLGTPVHLDWPVLIGFAAAAVLGALVGGHLANRAQPRRLSTAFTVLLLAVAAYTAALSVPELVRKWP